MYGTTVLITKRAGVYGCSCGGVAYLGILIGWALSSGDDGLSIPLLLLILGAFLTAMGTWWTDLRAALMRALPAFPGKDRLPPYARTP